MDYLYLALSLLAGSIKGICGKTMSGIVQSLKGTIFINLLRMTLCVLVGFFIVLPEGLSVLTLNFHSFLIVLLSGFSTAMFVVSWIICVRKGSYVMLNVFLMLGTGVTIGLCKVFFGEDISLRQYIGFFMLVIAAYILCTYSAKIKSPFTVKSFVILLLCGILNGLTDFSQKWYIYAVTDENAAAFIFYTYLFSAFILLAFFVITNLREKCPNDGKSLRIFMIVSMMAVCLFANSYFKTLAAKTIDSVILYPLVNGVGLILSVLNASIFFHEKITPKCILGVVLAFVSLLVMNM